MLPTLTTWLLAGPCWIILSEERARVAAWLVSELAPSVNEEVSALVQLSALFPESTQMRSSALEQLSAVFPESARMLSSAFVRLSAVFLRLPECSRARSCVTQRCFVSLP